MVKKNYIKTDPNTRLTRTQKNILEYLMSHGESYPAKMSKKSNMDMNVGSITENIQAIILKFSGLLSWDEKRKPDNEIKSKGMVVYYKVANICLANKLIYEFNDYKKQRPARRKSRRAFFLYMINCIIFQQ